MNYCLPIEDYFEPKKSLSELFDKLCDTNLFPNASSPGLNRQVINFVLRYLIDYLEVKEVDSGQISNLIRSKIKILLERDKHVLMDIMFSEDPKSLETDVFGIECLADLRSTAALVKEIIFTERWSSNRAYNSVDLGTGTGILAVASAIHGIRSGAEKVISIGIDYQDMSLFKARNLTSDLRGAEFLFQKGDLQDPALYEVLSKRAIDYYISETIGSSTPRALLEERDLRWLDDHEILRQLSAYVDPYPAVVDNLKTIPGLFEQLRSGRVSMFPNIFTGNYFPDRGSSKIILRSSSYQKGLIKLQDVGNEFSTFQDLGFRRWKDDEVNVEM